MSISILIADDQKIIRESLKTLLETQVDFIILGEANNGIQAVDLCRDLQPDILILDMAEVIVAIGVILEQAKAGRRKLNQYKY